MWNRSTLPAQAAGGPAIGLVVASLRLCLALSDEHGYAARLATNYDGLIVSALLEAQSDAHVSAGTPAPAHFAA